MRTCHNWCLQALADAAFHWQTLLTQSAQALDDNALHLPMQISPSRCTHTMISVCSPLPKVAFYCPMSLSRCKHSMSDPCKHSKLLSGVGRCRLLEAHKPWMMVHVVGWLQCCPTVAHTPWVMRACLGWCFISFSYVTFQMHTNRVRWMWTLSDVAVGWYFMADQCRTWLKSLSQCAHAIADLCRLSLMLPAIGPLLMRAVHDWYHPVDAHTPQLMRAWLGCYYLLWRCCFADACTQATIDVSSQCTPTMIDVAQPLWSSHFWYV